MIQIMSLIALHVSHMQSCACTDKIEEYFTLHHSVHTRAIPITKVRLTSNGISWEMISPKNKHLHALLRGQMKLKPLNKHLETNAGLHLIFRSL